MEFNIEQANNNEIIDNKSRVINSNQVESIYNKIKSMINYISVLNKTIDQINLIRQKQ